MQAQKANLSCVEIGTYGASGLIGSQDSTFEGIRKVPDENCVAESIFFRVPEDSLRQSPKTPRVGLNHGKKAQSSVTKTNTDPKAFPFSQYSARAVEARTYVRH